MREGKIAQGRLLHRANGRARTKYGKSRPHYLNPLEGPPPHHSHRSGGIPKIDHIDFRTQGTPIHGVPLYDGIQVEVMILSIVFVNMYFCKMQKRHRHAAAITYCNYTRNTGGERGIRTYLRPLFSTYYDAKGTEKAQTVREGLRRGGLNFKIIQTRILQIEWIRVVGCALTRSNLLFWTSRFNYR